MSSRPIRGAARLAAILDALPDALLLVNSNGTVVDANHAAVRSLQTPGTSLVGMGVLDLLPDFDPSRIPGSMRPAPRDQDDADKPVRMTARRTDGSTFPVEVSGNDFANEDGSEGRGYAFAPVVPYDPYRDRGSRGASSPSDLLLLLVRDLSSRLGVEAELRRQHKQTEMILRAAAEGVLGVDLEGRVVLVNPAAAHILDFRASELGGRELHPLVQHSRADGTPVAADESALLDTLTSGRKHRVRGATLWRKDGRPVTVDLTTAPVRDGDQLVGAVMTFTDRTRELALTARADHLTAVLETEVSGALTALRERIDALAGDPAGQLWPEANWMLRALSDDCRRFGLLIDGVLTHQRYEREAAGGAETREGRENRDGRDNRDAPEGRDAREDAEGLNRGQTTLDKLVSGAVEYAGQLVGPGKLRFSVHAAPVAVTADHERLTQALAHLVADVSGTALSDGPGTSGGQAPMVVLAAAQRGDVARIEVRGPGRGGSKVHVPIARGLVERHGGVLQPHELPNHAGTTYVVELPLDAAAAQAAAARAATNGGRQVPRETDTAVLPDLPGMAGGPEPVERPTGAAGGGEGKARAGAGSPGGQGGSADGGSSAPRAAERGPIALGAGSGGPTADPASAAERSGARTPFALGPGSDAPQAVQDRSMPQEQPTDRSGPAAQGQPSRRRRALPAQGTPSEQPSAALALPGCPSPALPSTPAWSTRCRPWPASRRPNPRRRPSSPPDAAAGSASPARRRTRSPRAARSRWSRGGRPSSRRPRAAHSRCRRPPPRCRRCRARHRPPVVSRPRPSRCRWAAGWASWRRRVPPGSRALSRPPSRPSPARWRCRRRPSRGPRRGRSPNCPGRRPGRPPTASRPAGRTPTAACPGSPARTTRSPGRAAAHRGCPSTRTTRPWSARRSTAARAGCWSGPSPTRPPSRRSRSAATDR